MSASETTWFGCADQNGKSETPERKHEAQLTILPLQHSKARTLPSRLIKPVPVQELSECGCSLERPNTFQQMECTSCSFA